MNRLVLLFPSNVYCKNNFDIFLLNFRGPILNQDIFKETLDRNTVEPLYLKINVQTIFCKLRFKI